MASCGIGQDEVEIQMEPKPTLTSIIKSSSDEKSNKDTDGDGGSQHEKTNGHKIASYLKRFKFYFPAKDQETIEIPGNEEDGAPPRIIEPPDLEKAWHFFENQCLPRRLANVKDPGEGREYMRASPGDTRPTKLYPVIGTPLLDMSDFGIGVGMYFKTIRFFGCVTFLAGLLSVPTMLYYQSPDYSPSDEFNIVNSLSAVCTTTKFQPCPTCSEESWSEGRILFGMDGDMKFILVNDCKLDNIFGVYSLVTMIFVIISVYVFVYLQRRYRIYLDEGEQTTSDYSIQIRNPPNTESAKDPDTWKAYFEDRFENLHVSVCTIAYKNDGLINLLLKKHRLKTKIKNLLPITVEFDEDNLEKMVNQCKQPSLMGKIFCCSKPAQKMYQTILKIENDVDNILSSNPNFDISTVFITFETEEMQRVVLDTLTVPKFRFMAVDDELKFEGRTLEFKEPDEPSSIRWNDLNASKMTRFVQRVGTFALSCLIIVAGGYVVSIARTRSFFLSSIVIILINIIAPLLTKILTNLESHQSQTTFVASSYLKVTAIRWTNTAIVSLVIVPFTDILDKDKLIQSVFTLFTLELIMRPVLQMVDWMGHLKRHIIAPRQPDQRRMNLWFKPAPYSVGERYTDITKLLFFTFVYCTIFPLGFFFAAVCFFVYYWIDKFSILRTWRQGPKINADISLFSTYFLFLTLLGYAFIASFMYSSFPFDDACATDESIPDNYMNQTFSVKSGRWNGTEFSITSNDKVYKFCDQDLLRSGLPISSFTDHSKHEWMDDSQERLSNIFGWVFVGTTVLVTLSIFIRIFIRFVKPLFFKSIKARGKVSDRPFSDILQMYGYVPQVKLGGFQHPILLCDVSKLKKSLIGWERDGDYESFNITYSVPKNARKSCFNVVKSWLPGEIVDSPSPKVSNDASNGFSTNALWNYFFPTCN
eukprot:CAMPEP_0203684632 /NCGR_PEP_ID=MMETSP0090-20130426/48136_1 /ASSEMBLY_ACC=CAM_ASM_001088 /TAXON_ID=426623 /ORGANISM="Chaetoceros affinis, Strain CCMP159" /LENGTH=926 /DNA_ID=CAMNT_0050553809 /DNA_START=252 /DNA_END=3032 /DNA_ORIENTATION=-